MSLGTRATCFHPISDPQNLGKLTPKSAQNKPQVDPDSRRRGGSKKDWFSNPFWIDFDRLFVDFQVQISLQKRFHFATLFASHVAMNLQAIREHDRAQANWQNLKK